MLTDCASWQIIIAAGDTFAIASVQEKHAGGLHNETTATINSCSQWPAAVRDRRGRERLVNAVGAHFIGARFIGARFIGAKLRGPGGAGWQHGSATCHLLRLVLGVDRGR